MSRGGDSGLIGNMLNYQTGGKEKDYRKDPGM